MADEPRVGLGAGARGGSGADPATVFAALAKIIYQGATAGDIYAALCVAATMIVPGCDHASLLVKQRGRYVTGGGEFWTGPPDRRVGAPRGRRPLH